MSENNINNPSPSTPRRKPNSAVSTALCGVFAALIAVSAFIKIPIPFVPVTLQSSMAVLAGTILGKKNGTIAVLLYVAAGLAGLPVFVQGGGIGYFAVPTFGYLIGFIFGAFLSGWIAEGGGRAAASTAAATAPPRFGRLLLANLAGLVPIYLVGVPYLYFALNVLGGGGITPTQALVSGLAVCLPGDMLLCLPISYIALRIKKLRLK